MALNINGTTGISGVDGSASAPAVTGTDSNTGINFGSDLLAFNTAGVERGRFDSVGNFAIGTSTPNSFSNYKVLTIQGGSAGSGMDLELSDGNIYGRFFADTNGLQIQTAQSGDSIRFETNGTNERIRVDGDGRLLIGCTTLPTGSADGIGLLAANGERNFSRGNTGTRHQITFYNPNGLVGRIETGGSSTSYVTSSDYRLKENATAISDGITRLKTLKPYRFNFKADATTTVDGFFAHEVTAVPEAISGTKDEVDSDSNPVHQGIDQSKLVPLLTAALQEAIAKIEVLETKVAALEAG